MQGENEVNTGQGQVVIGSEGGSGLTPPQGVPNLAGLDSNKIAEMISALQGGGQKEPVKTNDYIPPAPPAPDSPAYKKPGEEEPQQKLDAENKQPVEIPDKFKNSDGSPNIDALSKSYQELEQGYGKLQNAAYENDKLKQQLSLMDNMIKDYRVELENKSKVTNPQTGEREYTPEELKMLEENPGKFVSMEIDKKLGEIEKRTTQKNNEQREREYKVLTAVNQARANLPGFKAVESEVEGLLKKDFFDVSSPESVETAYHAAIGMKINDIVNAVRDKSFKEGMEHSKKLMSSQVEGGGRDTTPVGANIGNISLDSLRGKSAAEIAKLLPHAGDSSFKIQD